MENLTHNQKHTVANPNANVSKTTHGNVFNIEAILGRRFVSNPQRAKIPPIISIDGRPFAKTSDLSGVTGVTNSGKTTIVTRFIAQSLMTAPPPNYDTLKIEVAPANGKPVIYIGTELSDEDLEQLHSNLLKYTDQQQVPDSLNIFQIEDLPNKEKLDFVESVLMQIKDIHLLFIDQAADLVDSVLDDKDSNTMVQSLKTKAAKYKVPIVMIIHENSKANNKEGRGHTGAELHRKFTACISVSFDKGKKQFSIVSTKMRNASHFEDILWHYDSDGHIRQIDSAMERAIKSDNKVNNKRKAMIELCQEAFGDRFEVEKAELTKQIKKILKCNSDTTPRKKIGEMFNENLIKVGRTPKMVERFKILNEQEHQLQIELGQH